MARNDKQPFRREFTTTGSGFVGSEVGFFVPDILSLHLTISAKFDRVIMQGKVGDGNWQTIPLEDNTGDYLHFNNLDISPYEYVRFNGYCEKNEIREVIFFGYKHNPTTDKVTTIASDLDFKQNLEANYTLKEIKEELVKLNNYMYIITGDKL
jgi:hypothetical protein